MEALKEINLIENKNIAIVGGGPGGLTLARLLQLKGANVKVYERDENRHTRLQGATLDLHFESGLKAIEAAGLLDAFKANYRPENDKYRVVDQNGIIFYDDHEKESSADFGDEWFRPEIDRGPLRDILLDSLEPETVVWDSHIVSLENNDNVWKIIFKNGNTVNADIIIGADGANSKIRPFVTSIKPVYSGVTYIVGNTENLEKNTPRINNLLKGGKISAMADSKTLFLSAKGDGSLDFYIGWKTDEDWAEKSGIDFKNSQQVLAWFKEEFKNWDAIWDELFTENETYFVPRPLYGMPFDQNWETQSNITLLGDAAHLLPPNGEGVNMAMLDALELCEVLTNGKFADVKSAIAAYEKEMFERFVEEEKVTADFMDFMYSPKGLEMMVGMFHELPN
ncbi:FAD-dependent oxidoreductase [Flavobacterium pectinovorum]|uniref:Flavin-dependent monooxygenase n=1 Tax=Flavobacterium pectinovorum TaxID=29533 RepID=A0A502ELW4_9FLAO|nr:NAD(P)/FAD-dependent oxidoreductase [Flavobacterium pectinovorum]TPG37520.1 FAD-dependent monooxygenase [Flavobacterium pectinovorum]